MVGAGNTLTEFMEILKKLSDRENFEYVDVLIEHLELVANIAVRNVSITWYGISDILFYLYAFTICNKCKALQYDPEVCLLAQV